LTLCLLLIARSYPVVPQTGMFQWGLDAQPGWVAPTGVITESVHAIFGNSKQDATALAA